MRMVRQMQDSGPRRHERPLIMTTHRYLALVVATASGLVLAQAQAPGGWRSVNDRPPAPPPQQAQSQDPTQPVDRSDAYGQPAPYDQQPPQYGPPAAYGQPAPYGQAGPGYPEAQQ